MIGVNDVRLPLEGRLAGLGNWIDNTSRAFTIIGLMKLATIPLIHVIQNNYLNGVYSEFKERVTCLGSRTLSELDHQVYGSWKVFCRALGLSGQEFGSELSFKAQEITHILSRPTFQNPQEENQFYLKLGRCGVGGKSPGTFFKDIKSIFFQ